MVKHSSQRDCILDFLADRTDHPTAETVYLNVREAYPHISLATVYRNLTLLADLGEIRKISIADGPDRFDIITRPHNHFLCRECGSLIDLEMEDISYIDQLAAKSFPGEIEGHSVIFHGLCSDCSAKKE